MMQDLHKLHKLRPMTHFNNFFKSAGCKDTLLHLKKIGLPEAHRLIRTKASPGTPAVALAHPLLALEFMRWMDHGLYLDRLASFLGLHKTTE